MPLNLRLHPTNVAGLRSALGQPVGDVLAEMSAPNRILLIDSADVILERGDDVLCHLLIAARAADVAAWVVSATDGVPAVRAAMQNVGGSLREITIAGLDDVELSSIVEVFPQLTRLVADPRAKELLRRPIVVDMLVRSGSTALPLTESDTLDIIWRKLVRKDELRTHGLPHARDQVLRALAAQHLRPHAGNTAYLQLDAEAVTGLMLDGLLRQTDPMRPLPDFTHDLLHTYSVAMVLLSDGEPLDALIAQGAPRWTLPAARLAVQRVLAAPPTPQTPLNGRFVRMQAAADRLLAEGHAQRWADIPTEALLTLPAPAPCWPTPGPR